jgi:hypothetical protein
VVAINTSSAPKPLSVGRALVETQSGAWNKGELAAHAGVVASV